MKLEWLLLSLYALTFKHRGYIPEKHMSAHTHSYTHKSNHRKGSFVLWLWLTLDVSLLSMCMWSMACVHV